MPLNNFLVNGCLLAGEIGWVDAFHIRLDVAAAKKVATEEKPTYLQAKGQVIWQIAEAIMQEKRYRIFSVDIAHIIVKPPGGDPDGEFKKFSAFVEDALAKKPEKQEGTKWYFIWVETGIPEEGFLGSRFSPKGKFPANPGFRSYKFWIPATSFEEAEAKVFANFNELKDEAGLGPEYIKGPFTREEKEQQAE